MGIEAADDTPNEIGVDKGPRCIMDQHAIRRFSRKDLEAGADGVLAVRTAWRWGPQAVRQSASQRTHRAQCRLDG